MRFSYSNISTFSQCPYRWYLQYKERLKTIPETNADNALYLGLGIHKGIECGVEEGVAEYKSHFNIITDEFVGYIDYVHGDTLYDFKFSNNIENYLHSPQLSIYKYYLEKVRPYIKINHLKYVFVPKIQIRQKHKAKPPETLQQFRLRLQEHLDSSEIKFIDVDYDSESITQFHECCQQLKTVEHFPKNPTRLCGWCPYKQYCESNGQTDWMIIKE